MFDRKVISSLATIHLLKIAIICISLVRHTHPRYPSDGGLTQAFQVAEEDPY